MLSISSLLLASLHFSSAFDAEPHSPRVYADDATLLILHYIVAHDASLPSLPLFVAASLLC